MHGEGCIRGAAGLDIPGISRQGREHIVYANASVLRLHWPLMYVQ
jgi:hypothetical protein